MEEAWRENGGTEESQEDGATDEFEASIFSLRPKLLSDDVQSVLEVTACTMEEKEAQRSNVEQVWRNRETEEMRIRKVCGRGIE